MENEKTTVQIYGSSDDGKCGYCKGKGKGSWGTIYKKLDVGIYEILCNRGWRRSGHYVYKPMNEKCCCPQYTIKCEALEFCLSRNQKRVLESIIAFLNKGIMPKCRPKTFKPDGDKASASEQDSKMASKNLKQSSASVRASGDGKSKMNENKSRVKRWKARLERYRTLSEKTSKPYEEILAEYHQRRALRLEKNRSKSLEEHLARIKPRDEAKHFIEIRLVRSCPESQEFTDTFQASFRVYKVYQEKIHNDDEVTEDGFRRFLVDSPLVDMRKRSARNGNSPPEFGSYHQQYWLDGKQLIAVGVVDLLPSCLSSVYLFYHPAYSFLHLGVFSALNELALVRKLYRDLHQNESTYANFKYYYMGFYIHSCVKMRYKGAYNPSFLACPETYHWVPLRDCVSKLDAENTKYARFSNATAKDGDSLEKLTDEGVEQRLQVCIPGPKRKASSSSSGGRLVEDRVLPFAMVKQYLSQSGIFLDWARLVGLTALDGKIIVDLR